VCIFQIGVNQQLYYLWPSMIAEFADLPPDPPSVPGTLVWVVSYSCPVVIGGDFNVRSQDPSDPNARLLGSLLASFDMLQHSCLYREKEGA